MTDCVCESGFARHTLFDTVELGPDDAGQRFADVTLERCRVCGRTWLRYLVEYGAFSRSGRWARALIEDEAARTIAPETALAHLNAAPWYLYGGSYFDGIWGRRSGPMYWGP